MTYGMRIKPISVGYSEDKETQIRRDLRSMSRAEVAQKWFGLLKQPYQSFRAYCRSHGISLPRNPPSAYLVKRDEHAGRGKSSKTRSAIP